MPFHEVLILEEKEPVAKDTTVAIKLLKIYSNYDWGKILKRTLPSLVERWVERCRERFPTRVKILLAYEQWEYDDNHIKHSSSEEQSHPLLEDNYIIRTAIWFPLSY